MDTRPNRRRHLLRIGIALAVLSAGPGMHAAATTTDGITISGGATPREARIVRWTLARYLEAGLSVPPVEIEFHRDPSGCQQLSGLYGSFHVDLCVADQTETYARRTLVHELAHAWADANLDQEERDAFVRLRDLASWNSKAVPWASRGFEQAAEVITWAVGDRSTRILLPDHDDPASIAADYSALTGLLAPADATD
jgi:hypothetical protein